MPITAGRFTLATGQGSYLRYHAGQFAVQAGGDATGVAAGEGLVVPHLRGGVFLVEAVPQCRAENTEVGEDGAGVVQLVAGGDEQDVGIVLGGKVLKGGGLAFAPGWFGLAGGADGG